MFNLNLICIVISLNSLNIIIHKLTSECASVLWNTNKVENALSTSSTILALTSYEQE